MRYHGDHHVLRLFGPYMRGKKISLKNNKMQGPFFLGHTSKLNRQKQ